MMKVVIGACSSSLATNIRWSNVCVAREIHDMYVLSPLSKLLSLLIELSGLT